MTENENEEDIIYGVWARGGNPDAVDSDRVSDRIADGWAEDEIVNAELRRQRRCEDED